MKSSPLTLYFRHVKGHQTKKIPYDQLDWWRQRNKDVDKAAKGFLHKYTVESLADQKTHVQPILHLEKWVLARDGTKFVSIYRELLYINLYGSRTLAYWAKRDKTPKDPKHILW